MRTFVYVDGFNLYYGSLKGTPHKWLDIKALFKAILRSENQLQKIKISRLVSRLGRTIPMPRPVRITICKPCLRTFPRLRLSKVTISRSV